MNIKTLALSCAILPLSGLGAWAANCTPALSAGATITCTGSTLDGLVSGSLDDVTITVETGALLSNTADHAIKLDDRITVTNSGVITSSAKDGINTDKDLHLVNRGAIIGADEGVQADDRLLLDNYGTIIGADEGVEGGDDSAIYNEGTITGVDDAVQLATGAYIENHGTIANVYAGGTDPQDAIDLDDGEIFNLGTITSTYDAAIDFDANVANDATPAEAAGDAFGQGYVYNTGTIAGKQGVTTDHRANSEQYIETYGLISGWDGTALDLYGGEDTVYLGVGSVIDGASFFGTGDDYLIFDLSGAALTTDLFDGGDDFDTVSFTDYLFADIASFSWTNDVLELVFNTGFTTYLSSWERYAFATDTGVDVYDVSAFLPAVPVPAPFVMLGSALGAFGLIRRRRARRA
ncbi:MAG: hypothetical protein IE922_05590 [Sphingomonadales bacterium]|nr:hypothetical protein [Sphingomonadales bacterium]